jgi:hypothetical protein
MSGRASIIHFWALLRRERSFYPVGIDIGGVQGETEPTEIPLIVVMDGVDLEESACSLIPRVVGTDGDMFFQELTRFGAADTPDSQFVPVVFQCPVNGGRTYP